MSQLVTELYEKWVPEIYRFNIEVIPEGPRSNLIALIEDDINLLKRFFQDHNLSSDKRDDILSGYIGAGVTMRMIQRLSK